jgi:MerR family mercuric resistance operon transcriptional regulator
MSELGSCPSRPAPTGGGVSLMPATSRLTFIRRGRELGFSIDEIRDLLGLARGQGLTCAKVKTMTEIHIAGIRTKVKDLRKLERVLNDLAARCHGREVPDCPLLEALYS